jgi:aminoglycoside phosphotransferase (APT) family kinase protein
VFILDFNRYDYGDVIDEFNRIHFSAKASEAFACGMIDGFTEFNPSDEFFTLVALYSAVNLLASIPWGKAYSPKELEVMIGFYDYIMDYYNDFDQVVPTWYNEKNRYL